MMTLYDFLINSEYIINNFYIDKNFFRICLDSPFLNKQFIVLNVEYSIQFLTQLVKNISRDSTFQIEFLSSFDLNFLKATLIFIDYCHNEDIEYLSFEKWSSLLTQEELKKLKQQILITHFQSSENGVKSLI